MAFATAAAPLNHTSGRPRSGCSSLKGKNLKRNTLEYNPVHKDDYSSKALELSPIQEEYVPGIFVQDTVSHVISLNMLSGKADLGSFIAYVSQEDRENVHSLGDMAANPFYVLFYHVFMLSACALFSNTWIEVSGSSAGDVATQLKTTTMIP